MLNFVKKAIDAIGFNRGQEIWGDPSMVSHQEDASGVVIGEHNGRPLINTGNRSVAVLGRAGSGKTSGVVIPSLLAWRSSAVVVDRGDSFDATEGWRRTCANNIVRRVSFDDPNSPDTFNFFDAIAWRSGYEKEEVRYFANLLLDVDGELLEPDDQFYHSAAVSLLTLIILHVHLLRQERASLTDVWTIAADDEVLKKIVCHEARSDRGLMYDTIGAARIQELAKHENLLSRVQGYLINTLDVFRSEAVCRNTATSSFLLSSLTDIEAPTTVYLTISPYGDHRINNLIRAFIEFTVHVRVREGRWLDQPLLLVVDDAQSLGGARNLEAVIGYARKFNIKLLLVMQHLDRDSLPLWGYSDIRIALPLTGQDDFHAVLDDPGFESCEDKKSVRQELAMLKNHQGIVLGELDKPYKTSFPVPKKFDS